MANKRIRGLAIHRPIIYGNDASIIPLEERKADLHTHRWTVAVRSAAAPLDAQANSEDVVFGGADDLSCFIKKVSFKLHETIPNPLRTIEKPPYEVTETGWGEFDIQIKIFFVTEAYEKPITVSHHLKLHPWPLSLQTGPNNLIPPAPAPVAPLEFAAPPPTENSSSEAQNGDSTSLAVKKEAIEANSNPPASSSTAMDLDVPATNTAGSQAQPINVEAAPISRQPSQQPPVASESAAMSAPPPIIASPVHAWQYDELVFNEPTEGLYNILVANPITPLPQNSQRQNVKQIPNGTGGAIGELTAATEEAEGRRLDYARKDLLEELDRLREKLLTTEGKLREAKQDLQARLQAA